MWSLTGPASSNALQPRARTLLAAATVFSLFITVTACTGDTTPPTLVEAEPTTPLSSEQVSPPASPAAIPTTPTPIPPAPTPSADRIAFVSERDGRPEIYTVNPDGSNATRLTNNPLAKRNPAMSPDGGKIAFSRSKRNNWQIFVMDSDGSSQTNVSGPDGDYEDPAWSPDGTKILFTLDNMLYVMGADGSNPTPLKAGPGIVRQVDWAPDGRRIAFVTDRNGGDEIYVMEVDGSTQVRLTDSSGHNRGPAWSPDGKRIAFQSSREAGVHVYVMNADGSEQTRLTTVGRGNYQPAWSPDGSKIIFSSNRGELLSIFVMNADGSDVTTLIDLVEGARMGDFDPHWSHDVDPKAVYVPLPAVSVPPTPTPSPAEIALLRTAEELALSWLIAASEGNVDFLVELTGTPFLVENEMFVSETEVQAYYDTFYTGGIPQLYSPPDAEISSFTRQALLIEYERRGINPSNDPVLSRMEFSEDDIAVIVEIESGGLIIYFRKIGSKLEIVGLGF